MLLIGRECSMSAEQRFVNKLDKTFAGIQLMHKNVSKNPDVSFEGTINNQKLFFALEAKVYNKFNKSNYPKQLLAEILINRNDYLCGRYSGLTDALITYGLLLSYDNQQTDPIYDFLQKHILCDDWKEFGKMYNCKYVFLYDTTGNQLYYQDWATFLKGVNPLKY